MHADPRPISLRKPRRGILLRRGCTILLLNGRGERGHEFLGQAGIIFADNDIRARRITEKNTGHLLAPADEAVGLEAEILAPSPLHVVLISYTDEVPPILCRHLV